MQQQSLKKLGSRVEIAYKDFSDNSLNKAISYLIYGGSNNKPIKRIIKKSPKNIHPFILPSNLVILQWTSKKIPFNQTRIDIRTIYEITDQPPLELQKLKKTNILYLKLKPTESSNLTQFVLQFQNTEDLNLWWQGIQYFIQEATKINTQKKGYLVLAETLFSEADKDGNGTLDFNELKELVKKIQIQISLKVLKKLFDEIDTDKSGNIDSIEFLQLIKNILLKQELQSIFVQYCKKAQTYQLDKVPNDLPLMSQQELQLFFKNEQSQELSSEESEALMNKYSHDDDKVKKLTFFDFGSLIYSDFNSAFDSQKLKIYQDMTRPLTDYYINSSHNTYLLGNQLTGESSIEAYINAFNKGCRCVELDCWDGSNNEPVIYHGHTLTSKILFKDVVQTIKDYAFRNNKYPLILSLEIHNGKKQTAKLGQYLQQILGNLLYILPKNFKDFDSYPSPQDLLEKVLVKGKGQLKDAVYHLYGDNLDDLKDVESDPEEKEENQSPSVQQTQVNQMEKNNQSPTNDENIEEFNQNELEQRNEGFKQILSGHGVVSASKNLSSENIQEEGQQIQNELEEQKNENQMIKQSTVGPIAFDSTLNLPQSDQPLVQTITLFGMKFKNFNDPSRTVWHISSLTESKIESLFKKSQKDMTDHHKKYLSRIYPAGTRFDSSNYNPFPSLFVGAQVVALNFQTNDQNLLLYLSKFEENGSIKCGYLLKPEYMLQNCTNPKYINDFDKVQKKITIQVIAAQQLLMGSKDNDIIDPYIKVSLHGIDKDSKQKPYTTKHIENNGFNPVFADKDTQAFSFDIYCVDQALIQFSVYNKNIGSDDLASWNAIPVRCLRSGYRIIELRDRNLNYIEERYILCKIKIQNCP